MLILLTFVVSDGMSHSLSARPGEREEQLVGVKSTKAFGKNTGTASKLLHLSRLALHPHTTPLCSLPSFPFLFWCRTRPDKRQWFAWCDRPLPSCSSFRSVRVLGPACGCLWLSVFASVNMCRLTASQFKLRGKGRGKKRQKKTYRYLTEQSKGISSNTWQGKCVTWHACLILCEVRVLQLCWV